MKPIFITGFLMLLIFSSCKKDNGTAYNRSLKSGLSVEFDNIAGSSDLKLDTGTYTNAVREKFTVTKLRYYVSNFELTSMDGNIYTVPQDSCYFLIDESDPFSHQPLLNVPEGEYKTVSFILGVDSLRSTMDFSKRRGVLDPSSTGGDMYWGENSGYIFFNMEGKSTASGLMGEYEYHIGGYGGKSSPTVNNIKKISLDLTARGTPKVKTGLEPNIHLMVDILNVFNGPTNVSIAATPSVMLDDYSKIISNNYTAMFRHDHTEN